MAISVNTDELLEILDATPCEQNIMLVGKHGIGKSEILSNYYSKKGMKVVPLFLGQMADPGDLIGLPHKNEQTGVTEFLPPYWFPVDGKPIVLFLDELNRARPELLQTVMDLALNRKLAGRELPAGSRIISAVNDGEEYQLTDLDPALVSRFNIYNFQPTYQEWLLWATKTGVDERIIRFIGENPKVLDNMGKNGEDNGLDKTPDRRGWKKVSDLIKGQEQLGNVYKKIIGGIIGVSAMTLFFQSIGNNRILSAKEVLKNFDKHANTIAKYKVHELCVLSESLFRYVESAPEKEVDNDNCKSNFGKYLKHLQSTNEKEAFAHLINLICGTKYPKTIVYVINNFMDIYSEMLSFIKKA